jgi:hypothetical protein
LACTFFCSWEILAVFLHFIRPDNWWVVISCLEKLSISIIVNDCSKSC